MSFSATVHFIRLCILILCASYFTSSTSLIWREHFHGNVTRHKRQATCGPTFTLCKSGECIDEEFLCDGKDDCRDGFDESDCRNFPCGPNFKCAYGACISIKQKCDGKADCKDNSDELDCKGATVPPFVNNCRPFTFRCDSGQCIDDSQQCDGKADCDDNSDESAKNCDAFPCPGKSTRCAYGACVAANAKCNGVKECFDGSDEENCPGIIVTQPVTPPTVTKPPPVTPIGPPPDSNSCVMPNHPRNGFYTLGSEAIGTRQPGTYIPPFSVLVTKCNRLYKPSPPFNEGNSLCLNGKWDPPPHSCAFTCDPKHSTSTTFVKCSFQGKSMPSCDNPVEGTQATITCAELHEDLSLLQLPIRVCRDGTWDHTFPQCLAKCGIKRPKGTPNIIGGVFAQLGDYPWHAGIYNEHSKENLCGGSIINERAIVTAAHCFTNAGTAEVLPKEDYFVAVGKYFRKYDDERDRGAQYSRIHSINIPTRYKGEVSQYEGDIAVVILSSKLNYSIAVQPVCVDWATLFEYQQLSGKIPGVVVGWGQTVEGQAPAEELKELSVPVISYDQCYEQVPKSFRRFLTHDKVCAGYLGSAQAACQGDSGGGLTFPHTNDRYYIRGVVSTSPSTTQGTCDSNQYGTYTLISKHIDFVKQYGFSA